MRDKGRGVEVLKGRLLKPGRWSFREIFWDRPDIKAMTFEEFKAYVRDLRRSGRWGELEFIVRRYVERGNSLEAPYFFEPEEILRVIGEVKSSSRWSLFCDPLRLRAWEKAAQRMLKKGKEKSGV